MDLNRFDASTIDPAAPSTPIPAGDYLCVIVASEEKATKAGTGSYLQFDFEVVEGEHKGRKVFDRLNLRNQNATTVEIAKRTLSAICHAVNVLRPRDSAELHNIPLTVTVGVKLREDNGEPTNEVKGYARRAGAAPAPQPQFGSAPATAPAAPATAGSPAPWQQRRG